VGAPTFTYTSTSTFKTAAGGSAYTNKNISFDVYMTITNAGGTTTSNTLHIYSDNGVNSCPWYNPLCF
jgi:hypothetical protein